MLALALLQLLVGEVQKVLVDKLEDGTLIGNNKGLVKVLTCQASDLRRRIIERAEPQREDFLQMWP